MVPGAAPSKGEARYLSSAARRFSMGMRERCSLKALPLRYSGCQFSPAIALCKSTSPGPKRIDCTFRRSSIWLIACGPPATRIRTLFARLSLALTAWASNSRTDISKKSWLLRYCLIGWLNTTISSRLTRIFLSSDSLPAASCSKIVSATHILETLCCGKRSVCRRPIMSSENGV